MQKRKIKNSNFRWFLLVSGFICSLCCIGLTFYNLIIGNPVPSNPTLAAPVVPIQTIIAQTAYAALAQTQIASSPTPLPNLISTETPSSAAPIEATSTIFIFELQTNIAQPTSYIFQTNTPFIMTVQPMNTASGGVCSCNGDTLNCEDFQTRTSAQACFDYCISVGAGDIHKLDGNNDGIACEGLP